MGYFTQILIEAKERYGHILKERGLVMRGEHEDGNLNLVFKSAARDWVLPVEILVPGKGQTGKSRAGWEDVMLTAVVHSAVKIGETDWVGFVRRHSEQLEFLDGDDMAEFVDGIGGYLKEVVLVPYSAPVKKVAPEVAAAYFEFTGTLGVDAANIAFSTDGDRQILTTLDAAGQSVSFVWSEDRCEGEVFVDGKSVDRVPAFEYRQIQAALVEHFERFSLQRVR